MSDRKQSDDVREFLATRRARITPEQAGLPSYGSHRRVTGLRREEVAMLAGVSVDYYVRLERGNLAGASEGVLDALARALQLDEAERAHLFDLARTATTSLQPRRRRASQVRPTIQRLLDAMTTAPAYVRNGRLDVLGANSLGRALYAPVLDGGDLPVNLARFLFLDSRADEFYADPEKAAGDAVAILRTEAGRFPYDKTLTDLIGELSTRSHDFRTRWARHDVRLHRTGSKTYRHPVVGDLDLAYEALQVLADDELTIITYTAAPGSSSADGIAILASWAAASSARPASTQTSVSDAGAAGREDTHG